MRLLHAAFLFPLLTVPAFVTPAPAQTAPPAGAAHHARRGAADHFADANTTHDGRLTLDQAKAGYKSIAKSFARIDVNHQGYVTMDDIKAWRAAKKAARLAAKHAASDEGTPPLAPRPITGSSAMEAPGGTVIPGAVQPARTGVDLPVAPPDPPHSS